MEATGGEQSTNQSTSSESSSRKETGDLLYVRRSSRDPSQALLQTSWAQSLLQKVLSNHPDTVVLKVKDHVMADINSALLERIIEALRKNRVCQALYLQNLSRAMQNDQLRQLIGLLKRKPIWCLNIGENYEVTSEMWEEFCAALPFTHVTHLYVSEHIISIQLKNRMRANIRENRKKHSRHCNARNYNVIVRCTNMWWNPINGIRNLATKAFQKEEKKKEAAGEAWEFFCSPCGKKSSSSLSPARFPSGAQFQCTECDVWAHIQCCFGEEESPESLQRKKEVRCWDCAHRERKSTGSSSEDHEEDMVMYGQWVFNCRCGEQCSYYENKRYHPKGEVFACTMCNTWSHIQCLFGPNATSQDVENREEALCFACTAKERRKRKLRESGEGTGELLMVDDVDKIGRKSKERKSEVGLEKSVKEEETDPEKESEEEKEVGEIVVNDNGLLVNDQNAEMEKEVGQIDANSDIEEKREGILQEEVAEFHEGIQFREDEEKGGLLAELELY